MPFGLAATAVRRCSFVRSACEVVDESLLAANGVALSSDKSLLFVVDSLAFQVRVYRPSADDAWVREGVFDVPFVADNVQVVATPKGWRLWLGVIADLNAYLMETLKKDKRHVPGGLIVMDYDPNARSLELVKDACAIHDGSMLHSVATGLVVGGKVYLGGAKADGGVLVCRLPS